MALLVLRSDADGASALAGQLERCDRGGGVVVARLAETPRTTAAESGEARMCGIAGTVRIGDRGLIEQMTAAMAYRGPDDSGFYEDGDVRLGNRRLAIVDLSEAGHQPMESDDGQLVVNVQRRDLQLSATARRARGARPQVPQWHRSESILHAYREYGVDCLDHLEGMFGFALWDRRRRLLLVARDRTGIKPVFYHIRGDGLAFASELKPLLYLPGLERRVNRAALRSAIRYASNIEDESMLASVFKLPPGHRLVWRDGVCQIAPYWRFVASAGCGDPRALAGASRGLTTVVRPT